jgi:hypothetical protein
VHVSRRKRIECMGSGVSHWCECRRSVKTSRGIVEDLICKAVEIQVLGSLNLAIEVCIIWLYQTQQFCPGLLSLGPGRI